MHGIIYKATNLVNGKIYIGQTIQKLHTRIRGHKISKHALGLAIRKYGLENFCIEAIDDAVDRESLNKKEMYWVSHYNCLAPIGYNLTPGGKAFTEFTPERRLKMSETQKGKTHTPETLAKMSEVHKGKKHTPESCAKMSAASKGKPKSLEHRAKCSAAHSGKILAPEHRANILKTIRSPEYRAKRSEAQKGKVRSIETRAKITAARTGYIYSPESRAKMSASAKNRHATAKQARQSCE